MKILKVFLWNIYFNNIWGLTPIDWTSKRLLRSFNLNCFCIVFLHKKCWPLKRTQIACYQHTNDSKNAFRACIQASEAGSIKLTWIRNPVLKRVPDPSQHPVHIYIYIYMCVCTSLNEGLDPATATRTSAIRWNLFFFWGGRGSLLFSHILEVCVSHQVLVMHSLRFHYAFMQGNKQHEARKRKTGRGETANITENCTPNNFWI